MPTTERSEPLITAEGRVCVCGCRSCEGAYAHCLKHEHGCHLTGSCGYQVGMLCCPVSDPDYRPAAEGRARKAAEEEAAARAWVAERLREAS